MINNRVMAWALQYVMLYMKDGERCGLVIDVHPAKKRAGVWFELTDGANTWRKYRAAPKYAR